MELADGGDSGLDRDYRLISYWVLAGAGRVRAVLGETGIRILVRIMGLLLVALAMQFFVNGLTDLGMFSRHE